MRSVSLCVPLCERLLRPVVATCYHFRYPLMRIAGGGNSPRPILEQRIEPEGVGLSGGRGPVLSHRASGGALTPPPVPFTYCRSHHKHGRFTEAQAHRGFPS